MLAGGFRRDDEPMNNTNTTPAAATVSDVVAVWDTPGCDAWLGLGARCRDFAQRAAGRTDLLVVANPQAHTSNAPACFVPAHATIYLAGAKLLRVGVDDPRCIDPGAAADRETFPQLVGALAHEAGHAAHTTITGGGGRLRQWVAALEEPRMEGRLVATQPKLRRWLRASAVYVLGVGGQFVGDTSGAAAAVYSWVLVEGRRRAGVLERAETAQVDQLCRDALGGNYPVVSQALDDALAAADGDLDALVDAARRIADVLPDDETGDAGDGTGDAGTDTGDSGPGDPNLGDETGQATQLPCGSWTVGDLPEGADPANMPDCDDMPALVRDALNKTVAAVRRSVEAAKPHVPIAAPEREQHDHDKQDDKQQARAVFGFGSAAAAIDVAHHEPTVELRDETRRLTAALRNASSRDVTRTQVRSVAPPGRLNTAELARREGQIAAGLRVTAQPWTQTVRHETDVPPLRVGISCDVSGTMQAAQQSAAELAWALASAGVGIGAKVAAVAWNTDVAATVAPNTRPAFVPVAHCGGGSTGCADSLRALDGALGLSDGSAVSVVVVITDSLLGDTFADINTKLRGMLAAGVHVLWVTDTPNCDVAAHPRLDVVQVQFGAQGVAAMVGDAIVKLLARA